MPPLRGFRGEACAIERGVALPSHAKSRSGIPPLNAIGQKNFPVFLKAGWHGPSEAPAPSGGRGGSIVARGFGISAKIA